MNYFPWGLRYIFTKVSLVPNFIWDGVVALRTNVIAIMTDFFGNGREEVYLAKPVTENKLKTSL